MKKRKPLSKKRRFEVFKRDSFTCQYCGNTPPSIVLECDHITPVSHGGGNDEDNLITACFDCNRGKSDTELTNVPMSIKDKHAILIEKDLQIVEFQKLLKRINRRINKEVNSVEERYNMWFDGWVLTHKFKEGTVKKFIKELGVFEVIEAMDKACSKMDREDSLSYFCGICWNKIKGTTPWHR